MKSPFFSLSIYISLVLILMQSIVIAEKTHSNAKAGYSIQLPDNWYPFSASDSQDVFYDLNSEGKTYLSVAWHKIDQSVTESDWTKFHFLMYLTVTEEWENPWGTILALDSSQSSLVAGLWAPQAFVQFTSVDSVTENWSEYIIFTAKNHYGYELYATGDTTDVLANSALYSQIFHSATFFTPSPILKRVLIRNHSTQPVKYDKMIFDLFGRHIPDYNQVKSNSLIIIRNRNTFINNLR